MKKNILIWGTSQQYVEEIVREFECTNERILQVVGCGSQVMDTIINQESQIDLLVLCPNERIKEDEEIGSNRNYSELGNVLHDNIYGSMQIIESCIPLLRKSTMKRIALLTKEEASIRECTIAKGYAEQMSFASLHMMLTIYFNKYRKEGFTFRCFARGNRNGMSLSEYLLCNFSCHSKWSENRCEENRLVLRTADFSELPW